MKPFLLILTIMILSAASSFADTRYVSDVLVVTVRAQPGNSKTVLTTVRTGDALEVLEDLKDYLLIRTRKGVEGYVRSQYVADDIPKAVQIKRLSAENLQLQLKIDKLTTTLSKSGQKNQNLSATKKELVRLKKEYLALQKASANVLQTTRERDLLQQENSDLTTSLQQLKEENNLYLRTGVIKWFLAGAGVLFFGWLLGKISRKKKRNYL